MWQADRKNQFKRNYKLLNPFIQRQVDDAIEVILSSKDPRKEGDHKTARHNCIHAYSLGRQYRILYDVIDSENLIVFINVGTHKIY